MCLFNRQIEFMASFSTTRLPLCFQEEEYDPSILTAGACSPRESLPLSLLLPPYSSRPQQLSFSRCTRLTRLASSHILSTPPLLLSSRLIPSPSFKVSARALSQVLEGRNLAWFFRPVFWLCCGNCLLRGTQLCSALLPSSPDVNTQPCSPLALEKSLTHLVAVTTTAEPKDPDPTKGFVPIKFQQAFLHNSLRMNLLLVCPRCCCMLGVR